MDMATKTFSTSDLGLASYLYCVGAHLEGVDHQDPRRSLFVFKLNEKQAEALLQWQSGTARVNALAFWSSFQTVKRRLFGQGTEK